MFGHPTLLTHSCTASLEMAVMLSGVGPGDEVIVPSYTFSSTANAVALRGAVPVFVDVNSTDLNISFESASEAITEKTKAIIIVHYGGVPAIPDEFRALCDEKNLFLIEDAAQAIGVTYKGKPLGSWGDFGCISFHATKNIQCGEGGALIIGNQGKAKDAEIIREKGTDRSSFLRGEIDRYTWRQIGSSYLPSDLVAAYLSAQLPDIDLVNSSRVRLWNFYLEMTREHLDSIGAKIVKSDSSGYSGNGHIFAIQFKDSDQKETFSQHMRDSGIQALSHYTCLPSTPAGKDFGKAVGPQKNAEHAAQCLVRIPIHSLAFEHKEKIVQRILEFEK
jgi:dTDP-4-amino-4,6-dideoxygalactose transaminase